MKIKMNVMIEKINSISATLPKYLPACDLSLATSLVTTSSNPKYERMANKLVKANAKQYLPYSTSPKYRTINITNTNAKLPTMTFSLN